MKNSYRKGAEGEREVAKLLTKYTEHRWVRIGGIEKHKIVFTGDVREVCPDSTCRYKKYFIDVKWRSNSAIPTWWRKVCDDVQGNDTPVLIYKVSSAVSHGQWRVYDGAADNFLRAWIKDILI